MQEKTIEITEIEPIEIFGTNESKLKLLKNYFPKLKIVARGNVVKAIGKDKDLQLFTIKFNLMLQHFNKYGKLTPAHVEELLRNESQKLVDVNDDVLVYGSSGKNIKARTANHRKLVEASKVKDMIFAIGPAGTGKTYMAVALAVQALKNKTVKRIILTRPAVEAGESLGFLPGDLKEKLNPYLQPLFDALRDMIAPEKLKNYFEKDIIQIAPLAFMRGRTLNNAFVILDEAQNATEPQLKMFLTRMGESAKFMITGDVTQIDLPKNHPSGLTKILSLLSKIKDISIIKLNGSDVVRHHLVRKIIDAFEKE